MGLDVAHFALMIVLVGGIIRTLTYLILDNNPENRLGKFLAYVY